MIFKFLKPIISFHVIRESPRVAPIWLFCSGRTERPQIQHPTGAPKRTTCPRTGHFPPNWSQIWGQFRGVRLSASASSLTHLPASLSHLPKARVTGVDRGRAHVHQTPKTDKRRTNSKKKLGASLGHALSNVINVKKKDHQMCTLEKSVEQDDKSHKDGVLFIQMLD